MPRNVLDELLDETAPAEGDEQTFAFVASTGRKFIGRLARSADEIAAIMRRGKALEKLSKGRTPPTYHPYLPLSPDTARGIAFLERCLVEPKLSTLDCVTLAAKRGAYFLEISGEVQARVLVGGREADDEEIELLGEDSAPTASGAI